MKTPEIHDVIIIGGGPAGLSAAMILGRCRRNILVFDTGQPRNKKSKAMHGFLTRDGIKPDNFLEMGRAELKRYDIEVVSKEIVTASIDSDLFIVEDKNGEKYISKKLLLATGIVDNLPEIDGIHNFYGTSIFHCPYCDGWEVRDKRIGVYGRGKKGFELSLSLKTWSDDILLFTDGDNDFNETEMAELHANKIKVHTEKLVRFDGTNNVLSAIQFSNGNRIPCDAIFFCNGYRQHSDIGYQLHLNFSDKKVILTDQYQETGIPGLFVAGDADKDMHYTIIAAVEGAKAGTRINMELQKEMRNSLTSVLSESFSSNE